MAKFKPGDVVELKSGSLPMTIKSYDWNPVSGAQVEDKLQCVWQDRNREIQSMTFPEAALQLVEQAGGSGGRASSGPVDPMVL